MGGWKEEPRRSEGRRRKRKQHESQNQEARHTDHSIPLGKARHERGTAQTKLIEQKSASRTVQSVVGKSNTAAPDTVVIATLARTAVPYTLVPKGTRRKSRPL